MDTGDPTQVNAEHPVSEPRPNNGGWRRTLREWIQVIVVALVIAVPIRFFIAEPFIVNGASMDPTFATGQFLVVDRLTYRLEAPKRGDVIVFEYPNDPSVYYIKRIIGLPGETVKIKDGSVTIVNAEHPDGFTLDEPYIAASHESHDSETTVLGPTQYFAMGDNRAQSSDSRVWGPLDARFLIGRPILRLTPLTQAGLFPGKYYE